MGTKSNTLIYPDKRDSLNQQYEGDELDKQQLQKEESPPPSVIKQF